MWKTLAIDSLDMKKQNERHKVKNTKVGKRSPTHLFHICTLSWSNAAELVLTLHHTEAKPQNVWSDFSWRSLLRCKVRLQLLCTPVTRWPAVTLSAPCCVCCLKVLGVLKSFGSFQMLFSVCFQNSSLITVFQSYVI